MLSHPLHSAGYILNPRFFYDPAYDPPLEVKTGFYECLLRMVPDKEQRLTINVQFDKYKNHEEMFGYADAFDLRLRKSPVDWWDSFGDECKKLQRFVIRVLSLTCSSSGCERNLSAFERVHSKRRNRLAQKRMNDLVFVMYNLKLQERKLKRQRDRKAELDDLAFDDLPSDDEWITEKENPALPKKGNWLGVFDEGEDCNTDDEEEIDEVEFITSQLRKSYNDGPSGSSGKRKIGTKNVVEIDEDTEEGEGQSEEEFEDDHDKYQNVEPNDATNDWGYRSEDYPDEEENVGDEVNQGDEEDGDDFDYYKTPFVTGDDENMEQDDGSDGDGFYN